MLDDLNTLVKPDTRSDPMSPLRWTYKSLRRLAAELVKLGHKISHTVVGELLKKQESSACRKPIARRGRTRIILTATPSLASSTTQSRQTMAENQPAISVDTKKKELVSDFKNAGSEWRNCKAIRKKCACTIS